MLTYMRIWKKKGMEMTFNACMKKHFDEAFGPYGFKKLKGKYPYWGRMIGDEILQIITYKNEWSMKPYKDFSIWGGVATVYRKKIDLDIAPRDQVWMSDARAIYQKLNKCTYNEYNYDNSFDMNNEMDMEDKIVKAIEITCNGLLKELETAKDIESCIDYINKYDSPLFNILSFENLDSIREDDEGILLFKEYSIEEYRNYKTKQHQKSIKRLLEMYSQNGTRDEKEYSENYKRNCLENEEKMNKEIDIFKNIKKSEESIINLKNIEKIFRINNIKYLTEKGL